jgi:3-phenylpropionate/cinnamic acid dioxygenase small subunit
MNRSSNGAREVFYQREKGLLDDEPYEAWMAYLRFTI